MRIERGVTQEELADAVGVSLSTIQRLEGGRVDDPGIRLLHNCAIALASNPYTLSPTKWYFWTAFSEERPQPPNWSEFFDSDQEGAGDMGVDEVSGWIK